MVVQNLEEMVDQNSEEMVDQKSSQKSLLLTVEAAGNQLVQNKIMPGVNLPCVMPVISSNGEEIIFKKLQKTPKITFD